ncbi:hypothetical protein D3C87_1535390 [compost metagenome]
MVTMMAIFTMRLSAVNIGVWIAPDEISQPYQSNAIERPIDTTGMMLVVNLATIGVTMFTNMFVTLLSIH